MTRPRPAPHSGHCRRPAAPRPPRATRARSPDSSPVRSPAVGCYRGHWRGFIVRLRPVTVGRRVLEPGFEIGDLVVDVAAAPVRSAIVSRAASMSVSSSAASSRCPRPGIRGRQRSRPARRRCCVILASTRWSSMRLCVRHRGTAVRQAAHRRFRGPAPNCRGRFWPLFPRGPLATTLAVL